MRAAQSVILLFAIALAASGFYMPDGEAIVMQDGSRLWIEGASTVSGWTCSADEIEGAATISAVETTETNTFRPTARLSVPVRTFDCGRSRMNRDFMDALKADDHPRIEYTLREARVLQTSGAEDGWHLIKVTGDLTIAGVTRAIEVEAWGRQNDNGEFRIRGNKPLKMTTFGIEPPVALLGLVRAYDHIDVHFDLVAVPERLATR